jgi:hypothetical protein
MTPRKTARKKASMSGLARRTSDTRPSAAEMAAQMWHKEWHSGPGYRKCWCCCVACKHANPHHCEARKAAVADIAARIRDSFASALPPKPEQ